MAAKTMLECAGKASSIPRCIFIFLCFGLWVSSCQAEFFSSVDSIQLLANIEKQLIQWFRQFILTQAEDFAVYRNFIAKVKEEHTLALEDPESYLGNPINAFKLIKRTVIDWTQLTEYVENHPRLQALKENFTEFETDVKMPDSSELRGAAKGLGRLQTMYNLSSKDLADGIINDIYYGSELSTRECFEIGANLFEAKEYPLAISWFKLVLKSLEIRADTLRNGIARINDENGVPTQEVNETATTEGTSRLNCDEGYNSTMDECENGLGDEEYLDGEEYENCVGDEEEDYAEGYGVFSPVALYELDKDETGEQNETHKDILDVKPDFRSVPNLNSDKENDITLKLGKDSLTNPKTQPSTFEDDLLAHKIYIETLEYLAIAEYKLGKEENGTAYMDKILELEPEHTFKDLKLYMKTKEVLNQDYFGSLSMLQKNEWYSNYSRLCQGKQLPQKDFHKLKCKLDSLNHPLFILAPLRKEELLADPEIVVYYGLLSDMQIEDILESADGNMYRSEVGDAHFSQVSDVRVSQQTGLPYEIPTMKYIYRTVSAISGFDLISAEAMQVANYGVGGQYDPHFDFFGLKGEDNSQLTGGDRLSTHLFYISDVEQGGYTVFPHINVYSKPVKGAMVMWHNLHKSLDPDWRTLHAGCPVIKGTKRISNVWVHSEYQEFRRPCDVIRDNYKSAPYNLNIA